MAAGGAGTCTAMLRSRRRDVSIKPNRVLDRSSSRVMLYENEELRLRTININAEVEQGQNDIKKLRRENEHLRREIWCLREECDRLTALLQAQEEEGEDEEEESERPEETTKKEWRKSCEDGEEDGLSVLTEEPEEPPPSTPQSNNKVFENGERRCEKYRGALPPCLRVNCVHPFTVASTVDLQTSPPVTVPEVVEAGWSIVGEKLVGARMVSGGGVYLSVSDKGAVTKLVDAGLPLRGGTVTLHLHDVSQGTIVLALSGVPHTMTDTQLAHTIAQFGPIIGYIETRYYRNVDTGERLARLKQQSSLPKRLYIEGQEISTRIVPHDELAQLAQLPFQIARSTDLHVRLDAPIIKIESSNGSNAGRSEDKNGGDAGCGGLPTAATSPASATTSHPQPFTFPTTPIPAQISHPNSKEEADRSQSLPPGSMPTTPSPSTVRRGVSETDVGGGSGTGSRRLGYKVSRRGRSPDNTPVTRSSIRRKPSGSTRRNVTAVSSEQNAHGTAAPDRERSISVASRLSQRRKLSDAGREVGKIPWCGCWGNACV